MHVTVCAMAACTLSSAVYWIEVVKRNRYVKYGPLFYDHDLCMEYMKTLINRYGFMENVNIQCCKRGSNTPDCTSAGSGW